MKRKRMKGKDSLRHALGAWWCWLCVCVVGLAALGANPAWGDELSTRKLYVVSFSPTYTYRMKPRQQLRIRFNTPVVSASALGKTLKMPPVIVTPMVRSVAYWSDAQTLVFRPLQDYASSTRYTVRVLLPGMARPYKRSFVYKSVRLLRYTGVKYRFSPRNPVIALEWNQLIRIKHVLGSCALYTKGEQAVRLRLVAPRYRPVARKMKVQPVRKLSGGKYYRMRCRALMGVGGNYAHARRYAYLYFRTRQSFRVTGFAPSGKEVRYDKVPLRLTFSAPVKLKELRKHLTLTPTPKGFAWKGALNYYRTEFRMRLRLDEQKTYTVTLRKGLKDAFGRPLRKAHRWVFITAKAQPRLVVERGQFAVEASRGYPVWFRDLQSFKVHCARVPQTRILALLEVLKGYRKNFLLGNPHKRKIGWKAMGLTPQTHTVTVKGKAKQWNLKHLSLGKLCDKGDQRGLFVAEFRHVTEPARDDDDKAPKDLGEEPPHRVVANLTNLLVLLKTGASNGLVWAADVRTGRPAVGAKVQLFDRKKKLLFTGTTDAKGMLRIPGTAKLKPHRNQIWGLVTRGKDIALVDNQWRDGLYAWSFGVPVGSYKRSISIRGFIQSDRGIYRPGEKVHFKGLVREIAFGKLPRVPTEKTIDVVVTNSRTEEIQRKALTLSRFGGFHLTIDLPKGAPLGDYYVKAKLRGHTFREKFSVQEFRTLQFNAKLRKAFEQEGKLGISLRGAYLFGAPLADAKVSWKAYARRRYLRFSRFSGFNFVDDARYNYWYYSSRSSYRSYLTNGIGKLGKDGKLTFSFKKKPAQGPTDYIVQATVRDKSGQSVSTSKVVQTHQSALYVGLKNSSYVVDVKKPFAVRLVAVDQQGKRRVATAAKVSLQRVRYYRKKTRYGYYRWRSRLETVSLQDVQIAAAGNVSVSLKASVPGSYVIRVKARDKQGRLAVASRYVWVSGYGGFSWRSSASARMSLLASKPMYQVGEVARIIPRTGLRGSALVTVERSGIAESFVVDLKHPGKGISLPIKAHHAPNAFVSIFLFQPRRGDGAKKRPRFQLGVVQLNVSTKQHALKVQVTTEKPTYKPGQLVKGVIRVLSQGRPVQAEVSLSVADEGVLQLINYRTPNPKKKFYAAWGWGVSNATNLNKLLYVKKAENIIRQQGADGPGAAKRQAMRVRSKFVASAYWAPMLVTNAKGEVSFSFKLPDNLTAFRLMAVAADIGSRFGAGEGSIRVRMPLMAKPILPRFLTLKDAAFVGVTVHNYSGAAGEAQVSMKATGVQTTGTQKTIRLANNGISRVLFRVQAQDVKQATFLFSVKLGKFSDAVRKKLPIHRMLLRETKVLARGKLDNGSFARALSWPQQGLLDESRLLVRVDRTGVGALRESLMYLIRYPYGCLEQTLSKTIPLTKARELLSDLDLRPSQRRSMKRFLRIGLDKVVRHQHDGGHFSLWPGGKPSPHLTAYALFGLNEARRAGLKVDKKAIKKGTKALKAWTKGAANQLTFGGKSATLAMAAFVLAELGSPDSGLNAKLFEERKLLPTYGKAFLLRAMKRAGAPAKTIKRFTSELTQTIYLKGAIAMTKSCATLHSAALCKPLSWYMSSNVRTMAIVTSALLDVAPKHPMIPYLIRGLRARQSAQGRWSNTQENLYSLIATADYVRQLSKGSTSMTLQLGNRTIQRTLTGRKVYTFRPLLKNLQPGELKITTKGYLHYRVLLSTVKRQGANNHMFRGMRVSRLYLDPKTKQAIHHAKIGQIVLVRLIVQTPSTQYYVALSDPLPAGLEAINEKLATTARSRRRNRRGYLWNYYALRDNRVDAFANKMYKGRHVFEYRARATIAGSFLAAPTTIEAMYKPHIFGRSAKESFQVKP